MWLLAMPNHRAERIADSINGVIVRVHNIARHIA
jgi:hypothetical protein